MELNRNKRSHRRITKLWLTSFALICNIQKIPQEYSEIPLLRPPKIQTYYPLKTLF